MKILMAVSNDGFLATGPGDDMSWTGSMDKAIFRLLTLTSRQLLLAGWRTAEILPVLHHRVVHPLSRAGLTLEVAAECYPDAWLIGGPTVAAAALRLGLVTQTILCRSPATLGGGVPLDEVSRHLPTTPAHTVQIGDVKVMIFTPPPFR